MNEYEVFGIQYERVDVEQVRAAYAALTERVRNARPPTKRPPAWTSTKIAKHVGTMLTIAQIRNTIDTRDAFTRPSRRLSTKTRPAERASRVLYARAVRKPFRCAEKVRLDFCS
ncbi:MAG: hypothetical protein ACLUFV_03655 [Acutalibacteraceae bacterium]